VVDIREVNQPRAGRAAADALMPDFQPGRLKIFRIRKHRARRRQQDGGEELAAAEAGKFH
jgi:hypothetical protein